MDRTTNATRLVSAGFPRSGNAFLRQLLEQSFPEVDVVEFTHNTNTLNIVDCIVPIRNPYQAVPSWNAFSGEQSLESTAKWYMRFNTKVLDNMASLNVIDFCDLTSNPLEVISSLSVRYSLSPSKVDLTSIDKNSKFKSYKDYDSPLMESCYSLYKEVVKKAGLFQQKRLTKEPLCQDI